MMALKYGILGLLSYHPMAGYDLLKTFRESLAYFWTAQPSQIYRELEGLKRQGWAKEAATVQQGRRAKTLFEITPEGTEALNEWLDAPPVGRVEPRRNPLLLRLFFQGRVGPKAVRRQLEIVRDRARNQAHRLSSVAREAVAEYAGRGAAPLDAFCWRSTLEYGIAHCEMEARWAEERLSALDSISRLSARKRIVPTRGD